jgi:shikimate kinase
MTGSSRNIILTGFMGTGKSTVGRLLALRLGRIFVDTDAVIEHRHGPIPTIFATGGEPAFRSLERDLADELGQQQDLVIATGGGMLLADEVADRLGRTGHIICLTAPASQILERVLADSSSVERPLLTVDDPAARIAELLAQRAPIYARFPQLETGGRTPNEIVDRILSELRLPLTGSE